MCSQKATFSSLQWSRGKYWLPPNPTRGLHILALNLEEWLWYCQLHLIGNTFTIQHSKIQKPPSGFHTLAHPSSFFNLNYQFLRWTSRAFLCTEHTRAHRPLSQIHTLSFPSFTHCALHAIHSPFLYLMVYVIISDSLSVHEKYPCFFFLFFF